MCDLLEILIHEGENRKAIAEYAKLQAPVRMDLSALQARTPQQLQPPQPPRPPSLDAPPGRRFTP